MSRRMELDRLLKPLFFDASQFGRPLSHLARMPGLESLPNLSRTMKRLPWTRLTDFATHHTVLLFSSTLPLEQGFTAVFVVLRYILPLPNEVIELGAVDVASAMPTGSIRGQPMYFKDWPLAYAKYISKSVKAFPCTILTKSLSA